jgi:hypothetical protein
MGILLCALYYRLLLLLLLLIYRGTVGLFTQTRKDIFNSEVKLSVTGYPYYAALRSLTMRNLFCILHLPDLVGDCSLKS